MRRLRRARGLKPVHPTKWCGMVPIVESGNISGVSTQRTLCDVATFEGFTNPTIVRIRGSFTAHLLKSDADEPQSMRVAIGIRLVDEQVITPGDLLTASVHEGPWMWVEFARLWSVVKWEPVFNSAGTVISLQPTTMTAADVTQRRWDIDIKAMRRVPQNHRLVVAWSWDGTGGGSQASLEIAGRVRTLIKE